MSRFVASVVLVIASFVLAGCSSRPSETEIEQREKERRQAQLVHLKGIVTNNFFDPEAARFRAFEMRDVDLPAGGRARILCGEVNSKNRYGAYVGYRPFFIVTATASPQPGRPFEQWWPEDTLLTSGAETEDEDVAQKFIEGVIYRSACEADQGRLIEFSFTESLDNFQRARRPNAPSAASPPGTQKQAPALAPTAPKVLNAIPAEFRGRWGEDREECTGGVGVRTGITINATSWDNAEAFGRMRRVVRTERGGEYDITFDFERMEGETVNGAVVSFRRDGPHLITVNQDVEAIEARWIRC